MPPQQLKQTSVLITGGTSGLGLELVRNFLERGFNVVATGRKQIAIDENKGKFSLYLVDFSDLEKTHLVIKEISDNHKFDIIINNAGILSPPVFTETKDNLEYTFQVNFLAHLLVDEIIIRNMPSDNLLEICCVTSPVFRLSDAGMNYYSDSKFYKPFKVYSDSKFYLAWMCKILIDKYSDRNLRSFSFDPETFSSGIYRMQNSLFRKLYGIAAPFMRKPSKVAGVLAEIIIKNNFINGTVYNIRKKKTRLQEVDISEADRFLKNCYKKLDPYLH